MDGRSIQRISFHSLVFKRNHCIYNLINEPPFQRIRFNAHVLMIRPMFLHHFECNKESYCFCNDKRQINFLEAICPKCNRHLGSEFRAAKLGRTVRCRSQRRNPGSTAYHLFRCPHRLGRRGHLFQPFLDTSVRGKQAKRNIIIFS